MENKLKYKVIGLMSGTSLDGLDIAYCEYVKSKDHWNFDLIKVKTEAYPSHLLDQLFVATQLSSIELTVLDHLLGKWIGEKVKAFLVEHSIKADVIASHGHTIFHQPHNGLTKQIGNGHDIAAIAGLPVIYDFRSLDVALGGQGAPLVPVGDQLLFNEYDFCLNLGGIANMSYEVSNERLSYDIVPCNMLLNHLAGKQGLAYDKDGLLARQGNIIPELLNELNGLAYYSEDPPKSLGYEWVEKYIFSRLDHTRFPLSDMLCTSVEHTAIQISLALHHSDQSGKLLITGGGAFNSFLMERIKEHISGNIEICQPDKDIINYKEALVFGFLGVLRLRGEYNCLHTVTGANRNSSGGVLIGNFV